MENSAPFKTSKIYRKPEAICRFLQTWEDITETEDIAKFILSSKKEIEEKISGLGLTLRLATLEDINSIQQLHSRCFPPDTISLESEYALLRIILYGYAVVVEGPDDQILACNACEGYNDPERTAYGVRITVDPSLAGHNLGALLVTYTSILGMEKGSRLRRGLLNPVNYGSASNFLNYVGYLCESFNPHLPGFGPRFTVCLPLTPGGLMNNSIDSTKVRDFVNTAQPNRDYVLIACQDLEGITKMYGKTPFRVVAFIKGGLVSEEPQFLALAKEELGFPL